jgi:uncharacterized membrane protein YcaP (DUF421 family)
MKPEEIKISDWQRILIGEVPGGFFVEVVLRAIIIFILLVVCMRVLGRRMAGQLNRIELIALFSLAAAIGVPLQAPDRGILPAFIIAFVVVLVGKLVTVLAFRHKTFEAFAEDEYATLIIDGELQLGPMKRTRLTVERLYAQLRSEGIRHLGEVKRLYFEANGSFSLVRNEQPAPGLSVIPFYDEEFVREQKRSAQFVCYDCGHKQMGPAEKQGNECENCGNNHWVPAME